MEIPKQIRKPRRLFDVPKDFYLIPGFTQYAYGFDEDIIYNRLTNYYIKGSIKKYFSKRDNIMKYTKYTHLKRDGDRKEKIFTFEEIREFVKDHYKL